MVCAAVYRRDIAESGWYTRPPTRVVRLSRSRKSRFRSRRMTRISKSPTSESPKDDFKKEKTRKRPKGTNLKICRKTNQCLRTHHLRVTQMSVHTQEDFPALTICYFPSLGYSLEVARISNESQLAQEKQKSGILKNWNLDHCVPAITFQKTLILIE